AVTDDYEFPTAQDVAKLDADPVRCVDPEVSARMVETVDATKKTGETLGGVTEVIVHNPPVGLGSHIHWDRRLDSKLAGALMGIQAMQGVELGDGFETAARIGSAAHDAIVRTSEGNVARTTQRAGGIEAGMSTGEPIRGRVAMKPIATVPRALQTVDGSSGQSTNAHHQRSEVTCGPAPGGVAA